MTTFLRKNVLLLTSCALVVCIVLSWILYSLFGDYLISTLYQSQSIGILNRLMEGRADTPLKYYYQEADRRMVIGTFWVVTAFLLLAFLIRNPLGVILACFSCLLTFSLLFFVLEIFPSLINHLQLNFIDYYAYRANYIPDDVLIYRSKPRVSAKLPNFRGHYFSPIYNIPVEPRTIDWILDEEGFRNSHATKFADIVVIGDSYIEYGYDEADTFGRRLEKYLPGLTVTNLGKAGYGPFQYLEVLKRYGVNKKPKYALLAIFEGNDLGDLEAYIEWTEWKEKDTRNRDKRSEYLETYIALTGNFSQRYRMALMGTIRYIGKQISLSINLLVSKIWQIRGLTHPDIAVINVGGKDYKMLLRDFGWSKTITNSPENLLKSSTMSKLKSILSEFKGICEQNDIIPVVLYIPNRTHIYAEYSTLQSGNQWLGQWRQKVRNKQNLENAIVSLLQELNLNLVNLSPVFERASKDGRMLVHALDSHWNEEGRDVAAAFVAEALKGKL